MTELTPQQLSARRDIRRREIYELLEANSGQDYWTVRESMKTLRRLTDDFVAASIELPLREELARRPVETKSDRQDTCRWTNAELTGLGLAISCPVTGQPAMLHYDTGRPLGYGRFRIELLGPSRARTVSEKTMPRFSVCPHAMDTRTLLVSRFSKRPETGESEIGPNH
jgi:hypothetical protein